MAGILEKCDLAIIIPVLNCYFYTHQLVSTLKCGLPHRLILIDNGSTDETGAYFDALAMHGTARVIQNKSNIGVAASWNLGIKTAIREFNSTYFCILNNDILMGPGAVFTMLRLLKSRKLALVSGTDISGQVARADQVLSQSIPGEQQLTEAPEFSCFMLSKETIESVGYFDDKFNPAYFEDNDYHYRIKLAGKKAIKTNQALYFHYGSRTINEREDIRARSNLGYLPNRDYYVRKWGGTPGQEIYKFPFRGKL
jgi:GT2 family glycosyltransferase